MNGFFSAEPGISFEEFGPLHLLILGIILLAILSLFVFRKQLAQSPHEKTFRYVLGSIGIVSEISLQVWKIGNGVWRFTDSFPLAICFFSLVLGVYVMFTRSKPVFDIAYFWAIGGVASILFPDIPFGPDRFRFYQYVIGHLVFFMMFMYMLFVHGYVPTFRAFLKSVALLLGITLLVVYPVDLISGANFLFLLDPAGTPFEILMELLGSRFYVVGVILTAAVVMGIWYLPIALFGRKIKSVAPVSNA